MSRKAVAVVLLAVPFLLFMSEEPGAGPSATMDFLGKVVNFLVLFGGLAFVLRKPITAMLAKRVLDVEESLRLAEAAKLEARAKLDEIETKIAGLEDEVRRMIEHAETVSARERERLMRLAAEESQRIRKYAEQEIDEMTRAGVLELRAYAAEKATSLARERIRSRLTPGDQAALIDKSIERLSRLYEESRTG